MQNNGIVKGVVQSLEDPEGLGRVQVRFPHLDDQLSNWAPLASLMAGSERGSFFRPEKEDEVLMAFEHGDVNRPFVLGGVWSKTHKPPPDDGKKEKNNWRFFRSRSGHLLKFDDTQGAELIEIESGSGKYRVVIDEANKKLRIESDDGDIDITAGQGTVKIEATTIQMQAQDIEIKASSGLKLEGAKVEVKASAQMNVESSGEMTLKGSLININ